MSAPAWIGICSVDRLQPEQGVAALVGEQQVALFRTHDGALYAIDNRDPFTGAYVLSRGIVGTRGTSPTVASPLYKQVFDLRTGACLDDDAVSVRTFPTRVCNGQVQLSIPETYQLAADAPDELTGHLPGGGGVAGTPSPEGNA